MKTQEINHSWPSIEYAHLKDTIETVRLWSQIVGKIRLSKMPWINHSWHVTLYVCSCGLTTGAIPYRNGIFQMTFDFIDHHLFIENSEGKSDKIKLKTSSVANFYKELMSKLSALNVDAHIVAIPNEIVPAIPFQDDTAERIYDAHQMKNYFNALVKIEPVFTKFRAMFSGKCSPVHLFWGAFDLAVTRFSGKIAPLYEGDVLNIPRRVMQEAYSHEVSSAGFWPGSEEAPQPMFYAYCYPNAPEFANQKIYPEASFYSKEMGEFFLPYDVLQRSAEPENVLMQFLETTYQAAAATLKWDVKSFQMNFDPKK